MWLLVSLSSVVDLDSEDLQFPDRSSCFPDKWFSLGKLQSSPDFQQSQISPPDTESQIITRIREGVVLYQDSAEDITRLMDIISALVSINKPKLLHLSLLYCITPNDSPLSFLCYFRKLKKFSCMKFLCINMTGVASHQSEMVTQINKRSGDIISWVFNCLPSRLKFIFYGSDQSGRNPLKL